MRNISTWAATIAATFIAIAPQNASAGLLGMPRALGTMMQHVSFRTPILAPMAFTQFCPGYPDQCKPQRMAFCGGPATSDRWDELKEVNEFLNAAIAPKHNDEGFSGGKWLSHPVRPCSLVPYRWVWIQTPQNPDFWAPIGGRQV
jgi:predicted transglutaminase-like cysteine proteinase